MPLVRRKGTGGKTFSRSGRTVLDCLRPSGSDPKGACRSQVHILCHSERSANNPSLQGRPRHASSIASIRVKIRAQRTAPRGTVGLSGSTAQAGASPHHAKRAVGRGSASNRRRSGYDRWVADHLSLSRSARLPARRRKDADGPLQRVPGLQSAQCDRERQLHGSRGKDRVGAFPIGDCHRSSTPIQPRAGRPAPASGRRQIASARDQAICPETRKTCPRARKI